jgi:regulator of nucleoside diphosphate kinase
MIASSPPLRISREDLHQLRTLIERQLDSGDALAAESLEFELERAVAVPRSELPSNVVAMRSRVLFEDVETHERREAVLVYPEEADLRCSRISVLAPVGTALLGLSAGQRIRWPLPGGRARTLEVLEILEGPLQP